MASTIAKQRDRVCRVADQVQDSEAADERHRDGQGRDERRPPVLEEHVGDENDQQERDQERDADLVDRLGDKQRGVEHDPIGNVLGELARQALQLRFHGRRDRKRVGVRGLIDEHHRARLSVEPRPRIVGLGADLHARHIAQTNDGAVRVGAHDDIAKLRSARETAARHDGQLKLLTRGGG
jgi:hypothetical protein